MFDPGKKLTERELMDLAVRLAKVSVPEAGGPHPMVGAVIARDGHVLQTGSRGEDGAPGTHVPHAEEAALAKLNNPLNLLGDESLCTNELAVLGLDRLNEVRVKLSDGDASALEAFSCETYTALKWYIRWLLRLGLQLIGMLDPNPDIPGQGEWLLLSDRGERSEWSGPGWERVRPRRRRVNTAEPKGSNPRSRQSAGGSWSPA